MLQRYAELQKVPNFWDILYRLVTNGKESYCSNSCLAIFAIVTIFLILFLVRMK